MSEEKEQKEEEKEEEKGEEKVVQVGSGGICFIKERGKEKVVF